MIVDDGVGAIVGVGCETEPVSKNDEFQAFAERVLRAVHADGPDAVDGPRAGAARARARSSARTSSSSARTGSRAARSRTYVHPPANKIGVLVQLEGGTPELGRQLAMHIAFGRPEWVSRDDVPAETLAAERQIYVNSDEVQSKPEAAREKIVDGMLAKRFFAATPGGVLVDQAWIHDPSKTVGQALADAGASVTAFALVSVAAS